MTRTDTILLVEDTRSDALLYAALLRRASGAPRDIHHACSLQEALQMLERTRYAAVLLDLGLPDSEDLQGLERIVARYPSVPVVVLTGRDDADTGERAITAGAQDYLHKRDARPDIIERVLRHARTRQRLAESERRYRDVFEHGLGYICTHSVDGIVQSINPAAAEALGYAPESLLGRSLRDFMPEAERVHFPAYLQRLRERGEVHGVVAAMHRDGQKRMVRYHNRMFERGDSDPVVLATAQDITLEYEARLARRRVDQRLATLADALPLLLMYLDRELRVEFINSGWPRELRLPADRIIGRPVLELLSEPAASHFAEGLAITRAGVEHSVDFDDPGESVIRTWNAVFIPQRAPDGKIDGIHVMLRDVTLEKAHRQELVRRAEQDPLTGTLNRAGFQARGGHAWEEAARQGRTLAVFFFDLDGFKAINDTLGHAAGDGLLQEVTARVRDCLRTEDLLGRLGGDEFAVIVGHVGGSDGASRVAARLIEAVRACVHQLAAGPDAESLRASCSLGYCIAEAAEVSLKETLQRADAALYAAKRTGKGRAVQWRPGMTSGAPQPT